MKIQRTRYFNQLEYLVQNSPVTALLGPRQCGKTTLAKDFGNIQKSHYFDLESTVDSVALQNPETVLSELDGLIILDEIQQMPNLFNVLRVLVDRFERKCRFLILGSANPSLMKNISQSLAGRVDFLDMGGFDISEVGIEHYSTRRFPCAMLVGSRALPYLSSRFRNVVEHFGPSDKHQRRFSFRLIEKGLQLSFLILIHRFTSPQI